MPEGFSIRSGGFVINANTDLEQFDTESVFVSDGAGGGVFGVLFSSNQSDGLTELNYREIGTDGSFLTGEVTALATAGDLGAADLVQLSGGDVAVTWEEDGITRAMVAGTDTSGQRVEFTGSVFSVFGGTGSTDAAPDILALADGGFAIGNDLALAGTSLSQLRSFDAGGAARGAATQIDDGSDGSVLSDMLQLSNGRILTHINSSDAGSGTTSYELRGFTPSATPASAPATLSYPNIFNFDPQVITLTDGRILEVFTVQNISGGISFTINGRILSETGAVISDLGVLSDLPDQDHILPRVAATPDGGFVVAWLTGPRGDVFDNSDVVMRRFDVDGVATGASLQVNDANPGFDDQVDLTISENGDLLVTWTNTTEDITNRSDVYGRSFGLDALGEPGVTRNGTAGNDRLEGFDFDDTLNGFEGNDVLDGGAGRDVMNGGAGNDFYFVDTLGDQVIEELGFAQGGGIDTVRAFVNYVQPTNVELVRLGNITDTTNLNAVGNDAPGTLVGNAGANVLTGRGGDDQINGNGGDDTLIGNTGRDTLVGGAGSDTFVYTAYADSRAGATNRDVINGFDRLAGADDVIDLSAMDANTTTFGVDDAFVFVGAARFSGTAGELRYQTLGGPNAVILEADHNGDAVADFQIFVNLTTFMTGSDFIL